QMGNAIVAAARSLLTQPRRPLSASPPVSGTGSQPPAGPAPAVPATPGRRRVHALFGKVVSTSPLTISLNGHELVVKDPIANVGVTRPIAVADLRAGDRVSVIGPVTAGADPAQPSSIAATVVVKAAAKPKRAARLRR